MLPLANILFVLLHFAARFVTTNLYFLRAFCIFGMLGFAVFNIRVYLRSAWLALRLPGPVAYPLIGNSYMAFSHKQLFYLSMHAKHLYGPIIRGWNTIFPVVVLLEPKHIRLVLLSTKNVEKMPIYRWLENFIGRGLTTSGGEVWKHHRRILQPSFGQGNLHRVWPQFRRGGSNLVNAVKELDPTLTGCVRINVTRIINNLIFDILNETVLGISNSGIAKFSSTDSFRKSGNHLQLRVLKPWLRVDSLYNLTAAGRVESRNKSIMEDAIRQIMTTRKQRLLLRGLSAANCECLLDHMICSNLSDEACMDEVSTFMLAGQESVAGALAFTLHLLAANESIQDEVYRELKALLDDDETIKMESVSKMFCLERCIKEALRLYPSIPAIGRRLSEDIRADSYTIPAGTDVMIAPYATHRLPEYFPEPDKFRPDRFLSGQAAIPPCAFLPFSAGSRNCIGMKFAMLEMQTILAELLRDVRLSLPADTHKRHLSLKYRVTLRASGGVWVCFHARKPLITS